MWRRRFQSDPAMVGREIVLNGSPFTVVAIAPEGFTGTTILTPDLWVPLTAGARGLPEHDRFRSRESNWLVLGARLAPGVSRAQAQQAVDRLVDQLRQEHPDIYLRRGLAVSPSSRVPGAAGEFAMPFIAVLMGLVGLVLLVACANLAGLLLARAADRSREIAVRLALGAPRGAVMSLVLVETSLLVAGGAALGLLVSQVLTSALASTLTALPVPAALGLALDWRVLAFTIAVSSVTAMVTGLAPALQAARTPPLPELKGEARTPRRTRLRLWFTGAQMAFCLVLVALAGLLGRALSTAANVTPGFDVDRVDVASLDLSIGGAPESRWSDLTHDLQDRFGAVPGAAGAAAARIVPLEGSSLGLGPLRHPGATDPATVIRADWNVVSPEFFDVLRVPLLRGRSFTWADRDGQPLVAIVNEQFARLAWPGQDPIGRTLENGDFRPGREASVRRLTVVGVVRDIKHRWIGETPGPFMFVPLAQQPPAIVNIFIRHAGGSPAPAGLQRDVRRALAGIDRHLPLVGYRPLRQYADLGLLPQRIAASLGGTLGAVALLIVAMGLYGLMAMAVTARRREFGVRLALGADAGRLVRSVLLHAARVAITGGTIGLALAAAMAQLLTDLLFGVPPIDPIAFGGAALTLGLVTLAAAWGPARRAARTDPLTVLRAE
jgi:predicted permease